MTGTLASSLTKRRPRSRYQVCGKSVSDVLDDKETKLTSLPVFSMAARAAGKGIIGLGRGRLVWKNRLWP